MKYLFVASAGSPETFSIHSTACRQNGLGVKPSTLPVSRNDSDDEIIVARLLILLAMLRPLR